MTSASNLLGITNMTPGALGIWSIFTLAVGVLVWWIRGMPDRTRADTEARIADNKADGANWERFQKEIARLDAKVKAQGKRIDELEEELHTVRDAKSATDAENVRLRAQLESEGRIKQEAAKVVALDRMETRATGKGAS